MYTTNNLNLTAFLLTTSKAKLLEVQGNGDRSKTFVLSGEEADFKPLILKYFNGETFNFSPKKLLEQIKALKGLIYDGC